MSALGPTSLGAINLAGSFAGSQRTDAAGERLQAASAERKMVSDLKALAAKSAGGVGEADQSSERDADGRLPYSFANGQEHSPDEAENGTVFRDDSESNLRTGRPADATGERGSLLDLEA